jgi:2-keto-myo-inositol isomerase
VTPAGAVDRGLDAVPGRDAVYLNGATIMTTPTERHIEIAREAGFDGVELRAERLLDAPGEVRAARALVRPGEVWSLNGVRIGLSPDGRLEREQLEADLEPRLEICRAVAALYLLVVPPRVPGLRPDDAMPAARDGLAIARDRAARDGVRIAFEFLGFHDCPIQTADSAAEAVAGLDGVDLVLDSCHWHASGSGPLDRYPVDRLAMVHVNDAPRKEPSRIEDADRLLPGEGVIALEQLVTSLRSRGYNGPWSLETFNPAYWEADALEISRKGRGALEALLLQRAWHNERQSGVKATAASQGRRGRAQEEARKGRS